MSLKRHSWSGSSDRENRGHVDLGPRSWKKALEQRVPEAGQEGGCRQGPMRRVRAAGRWRRMKSEPAPGPGQERGAVSKEPSLQQ